MPSINYVSKLNENTSKSNLLLINAMQSRIEQFEERTTQKIAEMQSVIVQQRTLIDKLDDRNDMLIGEIRSLKNDTTLLQETIFNLTKELISARDIVKSMNDSLSNSPLPSKSQKGDISTANNSNAQSRPFGFLRKLFFWESKN